MVGGGWWGAVDVYNRRVGMCGVVCVWGAVCVSVCVLCSVRSVLFCAVLCANPRKGDVPTEPQKFQKSMFRQQNLYYGPLTAQTLKIEIQKETSPNQFSKLQKSSLRQPSLYYGPLTAQTLKGGKRPQINSHWGATQRDSLLGSHKKGLPINPGGFLDANRRPAYLELI